MQFIDKQGRIFGKWNIIDFLVVIFILSLTPMFYFGWKLQKRRQLSQPLPLPQINWEQKYNAEVAQKETVYKEHPRLRKYFK